MLVLLFSPTHSTTTARGSRACVEYTVHGTLTFLGLKTDAEI